MQRHPVQDVEGVVEREEQQAVLAAHGVVEAGERKRGGARELLGRRLVEAAASEHLSRGYQGVVVLRLDRHPNLPPNACSTCAYGRRFGRWLESAGHLIFVVPTAG